MKHFIKVSTVAVDRMKWLWNESI